MGYYEQYEKRMERLYNSMRPTFRDETAYKTDERLERQEETFIPRLVREPREIVKEVIVTKKQAIPRFDDETTMPIKRINPEIIGNIFDRVRFLEQRISEIRDTIKLRDAIHKDIITGIDADIKEKEKMVNSISDMDEKRNLKLDISLLMKEKRKEHLEFWRDTYTLRSELREFLDSYETEKKIAGIFGNLNESKEKTTENSGKTMSGE